MTRTKYYLQKTEFENGLALGLFLLGLFMQGAGLALLQTAVNPHGSISGPLERAARRISSIGICNKLALRICTGVGMRCTLGIISSQGYMSVLFVALLGLANSLLWPVIVLLSIRELSAFTERSSALLLMGIGVGPC